MADFYTFKTDLRPFGGGTPVSYRYDKAVLAAGEDDIEQGEMVGLVHRTDPDTGKDQVYVVRMTADGTMGGGTATAGVFAGISRDSAKGIHRLGNQPALDLDLLSTMTTGVHNLIGKSGDEFDHGKAVFMGDATNEVTTSGTGNLQVGTVHLPNAPAIIGDGTARVPVLIDEFTTAAA